MVESPSVRLLKDWMWFRGFSGNAGLMVEQDDIKGPLQADDSMTPESALLTRVSTAPVCTDPHHWCRSLG